MKKYVWNAILPVFVFLLTALLLYSNLFYHWDKSLSDYLGQDGEVPDSSIFIVGIDDRTLEKYGPMKNWSRDISRELVETLNANPEKKPAVIGFDVMYVERTDEETDQAFAKACGAFDNVVVAMDLQFKTHLEEDAEGNRIYNDFYVENAIYPFAELKESAEYGFANTIVDEDGYVRRSIAKADFGGEEIHSLSMKIYETYRKNTNQEIVYPELDENAVFGFKYAGKAGETYSIISMYDILEGKINTDIFQNGIVLVGAYAEGLQDTYVPAISYGRQMYGVEIQANLVNALLDGYIVHDEPMFPYAIVVSLITAAYACFCKRGKNLWNGLALAGMFAAYVFWVNYMYEKGSVYPVLVFLLMLILIYAGSVIWGYWKEIVRRKAVVGVLKQYVAPQIVEEISRKKDFKITLGGERRHIAVLFVDIRGFTTMSESMEPEQVVEILNEYLALTTRSIFDNLGTLDKFVGDATMAVFNAPFDLEDYVYRAVKTAWDMKNGADALSKQLEKRFGKSVGFGIGVNCGDAIVGNIGCDFRMDYTAIGDTVNTAARLESKAKRGQILISETVYECVKERISATFLGSMELKGKEKGVAVYQVDEVKV